MLHALPACSLRCEIAAHMVDQHLTDLLIQARTAHHGQLDLRNVSWYAPSTQPGIRPEQTSPIGCSYDKIYVTGRSVLNYSLWGDPDQSRVLFGAQLCRCLQLSDQASAGVYSAYVNVYVSELSILFWDRSVTLKSERAFYATKDFVLTRSRGFANGAKANLTQLNGVEV